MGGIDQRHLPHDPPEGLAHLRLDDGLHRPGLARQAERSAWTAGAHSSSTQHHGLMSVFVIALLADDPSAEARAVIVTLHATPTAQGTTPPTSGPRFSGCGQLHAFERLLRARLQYLRHRPRPDRRQEFRVQTSSFGPVFGRTHLAPNSLVTREGYKCDRCGEAIHLNRNGVGLVLRAGCESSMMNC